LEWQTDHGEVVLRRKEHKASHNLYNGEHFPVSLDGLSCTRGNWYQYLILKTAYKPFQMLKVRCFFYFMTNLVFLASILLILFFWGDLWTLLEKNKKIYTDYFIYYLFYCFSCYLHIYLVYIFPIVSFNRAGGMHYHEHCCTASTLNTTNAGIGSVSPFRWLVWPSSNSNRLFLSDYTWFGLK